MEIDKSIKEEWINTIPDFFEQKIVSRDLSLYYDIHLSKDITHDLLLIDASHKPQNGSEYSGVTVLPLKKNQKIQILISEDECMIHVILHELTHMYDMVLFSERFCDGKLHKVKKHKYFQTFKNWIEFHAKQIDIPYTQLLLDIYSNIPKESWLLSFKKQIKTFFYPEYNKKFENKANPQMRERL